MPFHTIPGSDLRYALINFDERGRERTDDPEGGVFSRRLRDHVAQASPSHVFLFNHGWKGDVPGAIDQYNRWIGAMWKTDADRNAMGFAFRPYFIGLHWPSLPWGEETIGEGAIAFGTAAALTIEPWVERAVTHFGGGNDVRRPLEVIFQAFAENPAARVLPDEVIEAYADLGTAIGFSAGSETADAPPDQEGVPLDPQAAVRAERMATAGEAFGGPASLRQGALAGLRQASFWVMKHRARSVGESGMHQFVADIQQRVAADVHLMGHSFGCIVVSAILAGPNGKGALPRPVASVLLAQGALSHWSFADTIPNASKPGYFRAILARAAVSGPIVTTQSMHDKAVGVAYPAAVGLVNEFDFGTALPRFGAVGAWGIQGTSRAEKRAMLDERSAYAFEPSGVYNVDSSKYIPGHSDIDGPQVAHLFWEAVRAAPQRP